MENWDQAIVFSFDLYVLHYTYNTLYYFYFFIFFLFPQLQHSSLAGIIVLYIVYIHNSIQKYNIEPITYGKPHYLPSKNVKLPLAGALYSERKSGKLGKNLEGILISTQSVHPRTLRVRLLN